jgi:hypothetical protein
MPIIYVKGGGKQGRCATNFFRDDFFYAACDHWKIRASLKTLADQAVR